MTRLFTSPFLSEIGKDALQLLSVEGPVVPLVMILWLGDGETLTRLTLDAFAVISKSV